MRREYIMPLTEIVCVDEPLLLAGSIEEYDGSLNARERDYFWDVEADS